MKLWNGRFASALHPMALKFSSSLNVDRRLYREDIEGSLAHVAMLAKRGIIPTRDAERVQRGLRRVQREIESGTLKLETGKDSRGRFVAEDIHMAIEGRLVKHIGPSGGRLHTARSRNDQVALDERLYLRKAIDRLLTGIRNLQRTLVAKADRHRDVLMPGYTHLQRAQPVLLAHHLLAYVEMLERDRSRFQDCLSRLNLSPLGAGALAGSSHPIDRNAVAKTLNFPGIVQNSIDAVSDRDGIIEFVSCCSMSMMHLSRMAEEMILWSSTEWNFLSLGDAWSTGSSIMPQKKNPDMAELVRGKTGRVYGDLISLLTMMKGLPLAYNRDMQEDKEPMFDAADTTDSCLTIVAALWKHATINKKRFDEELQGDFSNATELADYLVRKDMPFREAHAVVGSVVRQCLRRGISLGDLSFAEYRAHSALFEKDLYAVLNPRESLKAKKSKGSTAPKQVVRAIDSWKRRLA